MATPTHGSLVVNLTGLGGAGKSTVLRDLPGLIEERSRQAVRCVIMRRSKISVLDQVRTALGNPSLLSLAFQVSRRIRKDRSFWKRYVAWYSRLLLHLYCRQMVNTEEAPVICLIDEGILQYLGMSPVPPTRALLSRLPLPDIDLKLVVDRKTSIVRQIHRDKPVKESQVLTGEARLEQAAAIAALLLRTETPEKVESLLAPWGAKFCRPALTAGEIRRVLGQLSESGALCESIYRKFAQREAGYARVTRLIGDLGVVTVEINNYDGQEPRVVNTRIADALLGISLRFGHKEISR